VIRPNPVTIQLRYLQALSDVSANQGSTIVFPLPLDLIRPLIEAGGEGGTGSERRIVAARVRRGGAGERARDRRDRMAAGDAHPGDPDGVGRRRPRVVPVRHGVSTLSARGRQTRRSAECGVERRSGRQPIGDRQSDVPSTV
jgi:hypothetical protein